MDIVFLLSFYTDWAFVQECEWPPPNTYEPHCDRHVRPAKTQISLGIRPVWPVFAVGLMGS